MSSGIYQISNRANGKRYIGSAVNLRKRWQTHLANLRHGHHCNSHLQAAFNKHGESMFTFAILERVEDSAQLIPREQHFLDMLKPEYNILPTAGSRLGCRDTEDTRERKSLALSGKHNPMYGNQHSAETRAKMSEAHTGLPRSAEHCRKLSEAKKGHRVSAETRHKISKALTGRSPNETTRRKISAALIGHERSEETCMRMSEAKKAYWRRIRAIRKKEES